MRKSGLSVTLTRGDMIRDLAPIIIEETRDRVEEMLTDLDYDQDGSLRQISPTLHGLLSGRRERDDDLVSFWCIYCAEAFFDSHPGIQEVLFLKSSVLYGDLRDKKEWVASR